MKRILSLGILRYAFPLMVLLNLSFVCSQPKTITIIHTNDMHAAFLPHEATWIRSDPKPLVGGFEELWWEVDSLRKAKGTTLLLDAGDLMTGTPIAEFDYEGATGGGLFAMMNAIGYEAWTIGNHDLDISQDNLRNLIKIAKFPVVSANLVDSAGRFPFNNKEYIILNKNGIRIGIIGIMSHDLFRLTNTNNLKGLKVLPPVEVTQNLVNKIDSETDLIIALTHEGADEDSVLAVNTHGLDIIIGGHSHTRLTKPKFINNVIICQTGANAENLGQLDVTIEDDHVSKYEGKLLQLWPRPGRHTSEIAAMVADFKSRTDKEYGEVLGTLASDLKRGRGETAIGHFVADAIREGTGAQVAVTNSSGIRKDLSAGSVTKLDMFEISPFRNFLCTFKLTGKELRAFALRFALSLAEERSSIQVSGLLCVWKRVNGNVEIQSLKVGDEDVDDTKEYVCATSDFVLNQGDKYLGINPSSVTNMSATIFQALVEKAKKQKTISPQTEPRFKELH